MVKVMVLELYMGFVETFLWINFKVSSRKEENVTLSKIGLILRQNNHKEMKILKIIFFNTSSTIVLRLNIGHVKTNLLQRQILSQFAINTFISDQHNPQFLQSLRRRANARNVSFFTLYGGLFTFSTQLLTLNYLLYSPTDAAPQSL